MRHLRTFFILITGIFHVLFFKLESLDFMKPEVLTRFGLDMNSAGYVKIWAFNQGFYNLFLALGLFVSLYLFFKNKRIQAQTLAYFILSTIVGAALVLLYSAPGKYVPAMAQGVPALLGLIATCLCTKGEKSES